NPSNPAGPGTNPKLASADAVPGITLTATASTMSKTTFNSLSWIRISDHPSLHSSRASAHNASWLGLRIWLVVSSLASFCTSSAPPRAAVVPSARSRASAPVLSPVWTARRLSPAACSPPNRPLRSNRETEPRAVEKPATYTYHCHCTMAQEVVMRESHRSHAHRKDRPVHPDPVVRAVRGS